MEWAWIVYYTKIHYCSRFKDTWRGGSEHHMQFNESLCIYTCKNRIIVTKSVRNTVNMTTVGFVLYIPAAAAERWKYINRESCREPREGKSGLDCNHIIITYHKRTAAAAVTCGYLWSAIKYSQRPAYLLCSL